MGNRSTKSATESSHDSTDSSSEEEHSGNSYGSVGTDDDAFAETRSALSLEVHQSDAELLGSVGDLRTEMEDAKNPFPAIFLGTVESGQSAELSDVTTDGYGSNNLLANAFVFDDNTSKKAEDVEEIQSTNEDVIENIPSVNGDTSAKPTFNGGHPDSLVCGKTGTVDIGASGLVDCKKDASNSIGGSNGDVSDIPLPKAITFDYMKWKNAEEVDKIPSANGDVIDNGPEARGKVIDKSPVADRDFINNNPPANGGVINKPPVANRVTLPQPMSNGNRSNGLVSETEFVEIGAYGPDKYQEDTSNKIGRVSGDVSNIPLPIDLPLDGIKLKKDMEVEKIYSSYGEGIDNAPSANGDNAAKPKSNSYDSDILICSKTVSVEIGATWPGDCKKDAFSVGGSIDELPISGEIMAQEGGDSGPNPSILGNGMQGRTGHGVANGMLGHFGNIKEITGRKAKVLTKEKQKLIAKTPLEPAKTAVLTAADPSAAGSANCSSLGGTAKQQATSPAAVAKKTLSPAVVKKRGKPPALVKQPVTPPAVVKPRATTLVAVKQQVASPAVAEQQVAAPGSSIRRLRRPRGRLTAAGLHYFTKDLVFCSVCRVGLPVSSRCRLIGHLRGKSHRQCLAEGGAPKAEPVDAGGVAVTDVQALWLDMAGCVRGVDFDRALGFNERNRHRCDVCAVSVDVSRANVLAHVLSEPHRVLFDKYLGLK